MFFFFFGGGGIKPIEGRSRLDRIRYRNPRTNLESSITYILQEERQSRYGKRLERCRARREVRLGLLIDCGIPSLIYSRPFFCVKSRPAVFLGSATTAFRPRPRLGPMARPVWPPVNASNKRRRRGLACLLGWLGVFPVFYAWRT